jgi:hypothetical protein
LPFRPITEIPLQFQADETDGRSIAPQGIR